MLDVVNSLVSQALAGTPGNQVSEQNLRGGPVQYLPQPTAQDITAKLTSQILASSDPTKWSGEGYGSAQANAADMAKILSGIGITDISQFGKVTQEVPTYDEDGNQIGTQKVENFGNKTTGQAVPNTYSERQTGNAFGGTFAGKGNTGYRVEFDANGNPQIYTTGASSSDIGKLAPLLGIGAAALGLPSMLGGFLAPTASAAIQAGLGGAALGGGTAALTGNNVLKGALTGGALGYGGSTLGDMLGSSTTGPGYYDELSGKFISDVNGPLQGPLTNATSGTNLSSMANYSYDPTTGDWTSPDGTVTPTTVNPNPVTSGKDILTNAGAGLGSAVAGSALGTGAGSLLSTGTGLALSGLGNVLGATANQTGISNARDLINQYGTKAYDALQSAYKDQQGIYAGNRSDLLGNFATAKGDLADTLANQRGIYDTTNTNLANTYNKTQGNLYDIYNQQVGIQQPYQNVGRAGSQGLIENQPYFTHQFDINDLNTNLAPNYAFQLQQGQMANQRAANMGGGSLGGNALQGLQKYTQDYAGNAYQQAFNNYNTQRNNIYNSLANMANIGTTSGGQLASLGNALGGNLGSLSSAYGGNVVANTGQMQNAYNQYGSNLTNLNTNLASNLTSGANAMQQATGLYGGNQASLATGIGGALAGNATASGANTSSALSNLGNTALLASMIKAT